MKDRKHQKVKDRCQHTGDYKGAAHNICNLKYSVPKKRSIGFYNGSKYDDYFIIKELDEEVKK